MSVYEGIVHIRHPEPLHEPTWNVLNACTFEGISFVISIRNLSKTWKKEFLAQSPRQQDPTLFVIIYEDGAAIWTICCFLWSFLN
jgi:hypothetical protein